MAAPNYTSTLDITTFEAPFRDAYEGAISGLWINRVSLFVSINSLTAAYEGLAGSSGMAAWTGSRQLKKQLPFKMTLTSAPYEDSQVYGVDNFNADSIGVYQAAIDNMAQEAAWFRQETMVTLLANGTSTPSYDTLYDGSTTVNYFSTGHPYGFDATAQNPTGTQKNLITSATVASLNVADTSAPTPLECAYIIQDVTSYMLTLKNLGGKPINAGMKKIFIIVGDSAKFASFTAAIGLTTIQASNEYGSTAVTSPVVGFQKGGFEYEVKLEPALTGTSIYFLRADGYYSPLLLQSTKDIQVQALGPDSEYALQNNNVIFGCKDLFAVGPLNYTSAVKATLS